MSVWQWVLEVSALASLFFSLAYVVLYAYTSKWWGSVTGWHVMTSMAAIVLVLGGASATFPSLPPDTTWIRFYAVTFALLPFTQAWRVGLLLWMVRHGRQDGE